MKKTKDNRIPRKSTEPVDHWAFLGEIEAPMWVDLTLEAKSINRDKDDEWFSCSHRTGMLKYWLLVSLFRFHESSASELMTAFLHSRYACLDTSFHLEGPSSPMLPPSVSRRGKNYESRKWRIGDREVVLAKGCQVKSLSGRTSRVDTAQGQELKSKQCNKISKRVAKNEALDFTIGSNEATMAKNSKSSISLGVSNGTSSTMASHAGESNASSTVTSETVLHQQQPFMEVSSHVLGRNSGLLSSLKASLRKSCVTRQAARVEINDQRLSRGRKSSSSKSSVGSSINPVYEVDPLTTSPEEFRDQTPDSRHVHRVSQMARNSTKVRNTTNGAIVLHGNRKSGSTVSGRSTGTKKTSHESIKSKV
ncbi:hypothetical protein RJ641_000244 [Dillenia turbinata]|uniref:Uncharacterized protein n=1 Tax=Dillenia turbinata TaxID=194707 RepID=A0AAN8ZQV7_9MAGN